MTNAQNLQNDAYRDQLGRNIAARLSATTDDLPHDISERLKAARMQALAKRKVVKLQTAPASAAVSNGSSTLALGGDFGFKSRLASWLPLIALVIGLLTIATLQEDKRTRELAEVDAELLTDELPPSAYADPGFAQFLRMQHNK